MNGNIDIEIPMNGNRFKQSGIILSAKIYPTIGYSKPDIDSRFM
jgi:hypothetical protein